MTDNREEDRERVELSIAQVATSALAAVSAAVLCSFFGVAGTVIGTAVTSLVATVAGALYSYSLRRTRTRLRRLHQAGAASPPVAEVLKTARQQGRRMLNAVPWAPIAIGSFSVFVLAIGVVTVIEANAGETLSALLGVGNSGSRQTTLGSLTHSGPTRHHKHRPTPTPTPTPSPTATAPPTSSPTPSPSVVPSPTSTPCGLLGGLLPCSRASTSTSSPAAAATSSP